MGAVGWILPGLIEGAMAKALHTGDEPGDRVGA
jgi:hypothetical protein